MNCFQKYRSPYQKLAVYYGYPSLVNGSGQQLDPVAAASGVFKQFSYVVLGDGIQSLDHPENRNAREIISACSETAFAGYIPLPCPPLSPTFRSRIDQWQSMGAKWIFIDTFGHDYGNTTADQVAALDSVHAAGLHAIINAWKPEDVPWNSVWSGDAYFLESFNPCDSVKLGKLSDPRRKGVKLFAVTTDKNEPAPKRGLVGAFGWAEANYSATSNVLDVGKNA